MGCEEGDVRSVRVHGPVKGGRGESAHDTVPGEGITGVVVGIAGQCRRGVCGVGCVWGWVLCFRGFFSSCGRFAWFADSVVVLLSPAPCVSLSSWSSSSGA